MNRPEYNDNPLPYDEAIYDRLRAHGMSYWNHTWRYQVWILSVPQGIDDLLSKHISHLFIRDPLVVFSETIDQDDSSSSDHFEVRFFALANEIRESITVYRIYNQPTGKHYVSNRHRLSLPLVGGWSSVAWKYKWQMPRMRLSLCLPCYYLGQFYTSSWIFISQFPRFAWFWHTVIAPS